MKYFFYLFLIFTLGCARFPEDYSNASEIKIKFSFRVEGKINKDYIYLVALSACKELDPPQENGPIPVTEYPWGNGLVKGECTHYVLWKPSATPPFEIYKFVDKDLIPKRFLGGPNVFSSIEPGQTNKISFEITVKQLAEENVVTSEEIKSLKVNFITMNLIPSTQSDQLIYDSIGSANPLQRAWLTVPLNTSMVYDKEYYGITKNSSMVLDPDLKIVDFSVEVIQPTS